jgi:4-hydroxybenzoate polyprenyltransferase
MDVIWSGYDPDERAKSPTAGPVADAMRRQLGRPLRPAWSRPYLRLSRADRPIGTWLLLLPCWWGLLLAMLRQAAPAGTTCGSRWLRHGRLPDARRGLHLERHHRPRHRRPRGAHRLAADPVGAGQRETGARLDVPAGADRLRHPAHLPAQRHRAGHRCRWPVVASIPSPSASPGGRRSSWASPSTGARCWPGRRIPARWAGRRCLYLAGIAWTLFYDTIYAHQDRRGRRADRREIHRAAVRRRTPRILAGFLAVSVALMTLAGSGAGRPGPGDACARPRGAGGLRASSALADAAARYRRRRALPDAVPLEPRCGAARCALSCRCRARVIAARRSSH